MDLLSVQPSAEFHIGEGLRWRETGLPRESSDSTSLHGVAPRTCRLSMDMLFTLFGDVLDTILEPFGDAVWGRPRSDDKLFELFGEVVRGRPHGEPPAGETRVLFVLCILALLPECSSFAFCKCLAAAARPGAAVHLDAGGAAADRSDAIHSPF